MTCYCAACTAKAHAEYKRARAAQDAIAVRKVAAVYHIVLQKKILTALKNRERITPA